MLCLMISTVLQKLAVILVYHFSCDFCLLKHVFSLVRDMVICLGQIAKICV